jgi:hypothetical protein
VPSGKQVNVHEKKNLSFLAYRTKKINFQARKVLIRKVELLLSDGS